MILYRQERLLLDLFHHWQANLSILGIDETKTVHNVPLSNPFIERSVGTLRHEMLGSVLYWDAQDLARKLIYYQSYDNEHCVQTSLSGRNENSF
jgi:hypothetical protein